MLLDQQLRTPEGINIAAVEWFGVCVPFDLAERWAKIFTNLESRYSTSAGPLIWLKNRILENGLLERAGGKQPDAVEFFTEHHMFFIFIEETKEMLARLNKEKARSEAEAARSKVFREMPIHNVQPIDKTAWKVANS
jgi:hypothetical protein